MKSESFSQIKVGLPPGSLVYVGKKHKHAPAISAISFSTTSLIEHEPLDLPSLLTAAKEYDVTWINIDGVHDADLIEEIGNQFNIHRLLLEDIMNTGQRPKIEEGDNYLFVNMDMIKLNEHKRTIELEQVSLILFSGIVLSFQERPGDVFDAIRDRLKSGRGKIRSRGSDYLFYALMDVTVDHYFLCVDFLNEKLGALEELIGGKHSSTIPEDIRILKRSTIQMKKSILPLREVTNSIHSVGFNEIDDQHLPYFKDVHDHTLQLLENVDNTLVLANEVKEANLTHLSLKANSVMQLLTIIASIFIPLTFIAGIYGMNFENMPELRSENGYFYLLGIMALLGISLLLIFRRKKWL